MRDAKYLDSAGTPMRFLLAVIVSVYFGEMFVMLFIDALPPLSKWGTVLLDSTMLLILVFPTIYFLVFRPLTIHIADRKRVEVALRESEERLKRAHKVVSLGNWEWDLITNQLFWAEQNYPLHGIDPREVKPSYEAFMKLVDPLEHEFVNKAVADALTSTKPLEFDYTIIRPDNGKRRIIHSVADVIRNSEGKAIKLIGTVQDVTERRRAEADLLKFKLALERSGEAIFLTDVEGRFIYVNPAFENIYGYSFEEVVGQTPRILKSGTLSDQAYREFWSALLSKQVVCGEIANRTKDGRILIIDNSANPVLDAHGNIIAFLSIQRDVTERKQAEEVLRESEYFFKESQRAAFIGSYKTDFTTGFWESSETLDNIFGIDQSYSKSVQGWLEIVYPDDREMMDRYLREQVILKRIPFNKEYRIVRKSDGEVRWVNGLGEIDFDTDGNVVSLIGTIQDITERKRIEEEKIELERLMLHGQKLESLGVLAGGIAHDFNNLLAAIIGNLSLAAEDLSELPVVRDAIGQAMLAAERAADLTNQMLAYSGRGHIMVKELDLNLLVRENALMLRAIVPRAITLDLQLSQDLQTILVDAGQVQQVVMNLITNASDAIGDQPGTITVRTGIDSYAQLNLSRSCTAQKPQPGIFVWIEIKDNGCGMDEETQRRLFEPFYTTKFAGRGLGMSAVLGIVQGHGGALIVDSKVGKGTCMRVLFPVAQINEETHSADRHSPPEAKATAEQVRSSGTVLVVDDDDLVRRLCDSVLRHLGFRTLEACDGEEAIRIFQDQATEVSAVILDLTMPLMDGATAFKRMLQIRPDVKVILSSGYSEQDAIRGFSGKCPAGFLQKPYELKTLQTELERVLRSSESTTPRTVDMPN